MMNTKKKVFLTAVSAILAFVLMQCSENGDSGTNPTGNGKDTTQDSMQVCTIESDDYFELVNIESSDTFSVGDTIEVKYRVDKEYINGILMKISLDNGIEVTGINTGKQIPLPEGDGRYRCGSYTWVIGEEAGDVGYEASNTALLIMSDYSQQSLFTAFTDKKFTILN